jgi:hypothetical protein
MSSSAMEIEISATTCVLGGTNKNPGHDRIEEVWATTVD